MAKKPWTKQEELLFNEHTDTEIVRLTGRGFGSVKNKRQWLGVPSPKRPKAKTLLEVFAEEKKKGPPVEHDVELPAPNFGRLPISVLDRGGWRTIGLVGDTHLACKEERLAELHATYDLFEKEGITQVFHAGNIVDGYIPRINGDSALRTSIDGQCHYVIDNYPQRKGITTYFITGDDHEGWWMKEGFNFGAYLNYLAVDAGRKDLQYIGHVEADVEIKTGNVSTILKVQHPGGGSAYARSYAAQKQVESWEGGEKPHILVQGHYHVSGFFQDRNVHVVSLPGYQDQTIFARKKRLRMEIGGAMLSFKVNPDDGTVTRCRPEFIRFFTRGYYKAYLRSDARVLKGHLSIEV